MQSGVKMKAIKIQHTTENSLVALNRADVNLNTLKYCAMGKPMEALLVDVVSKPWFETKYGKPDIGPVGR